MPRPESELGQHGPCPVCGGHMGGRQRVTATACSTKCMRVRRSNIRNTGDAFGRRVRECLNCGELFTRPMGLERQGKGANFCSTECVAVRRRLQSAAREYGISMDCVLHLRSLPCAICGAPPKRGTGGHVIDHDHATSIVRGALCLHCNSCLGHAKDSVDTLLRASEYLLRNATKPVFLWPEAVPTVAAAFIAATQEATQ